MASNEDASAPLFQLLRASDGPGRLGMLKGDIPTPTMFLVTTRSSPHKTVTRKCIHSVTSAMGVRGVPNHLMPPLLEEVGRPPKKRKTGQDEDGTAEHGSGTEESMGEIRVVDCPCGEMLLRQSLIEAYPDPCKKKLLGLHRFHCHMNFRDPLLAEGVFEGDAVAVQTTGGRRKVLSKDWVHITRTLKPLLATSIAEECPMGKAGGKKLKRAVEKAQKCLDEIIEQTTALRADYSVSIIANIQGGSDTQWRETAAKLAAAKPEVAGFSLGGCGYDETSKDRAAALQAAMKHLPADKPRLMPCRGSPVEVLQGVWLGVDVFECTYPLQMADKNVALTFDALSVGREDGQQQGHDGGSDDATAFVNKTLVEQDLADLPAALQVDLTDTSQATNFDKLCEWSPVEYSRAYIHHLANCKEMNAQLLLTRHNLEAYSRLFVAIRDAIGRGQLAHFISRFVNEQLS
ncbi:unnamed protein product [Vitrella brassicaformis CCMP3155]|uniref:tRNA-guanine(15) transglycosylase-like domain-containing protein n=1 Tax=Vitrella brassicaformis (strain CCMP3155) TaxID=1169540 RepID=A0A0G4G3J0_VITBC|nr:unnamed protein product [Vitrella brassicaformis CCMP3155]|eukprot:CEM22849.1 unnamed protein product [Vitrella brassicaformis CCMP3155]